MILRIAAEPVSRRKGIGGGGRPAASPTPALSDAGVLEPRSPRGVFRLRVLGPELTGKPVAVRLQVVPTPPYPRGRSGKRSCCLSLTLLRYPAALHSSRPVSG